MKDLPSSVSAKGEHPGLHLIDGTDSLQSYVTVARRGSIFLGINFCGLVDGSQFGGPGKSYLHVRIRSVRNPILAARLDQKSDAKNVVILSEQHLALDEAWPNLSFEKVDDKRASVLVGMFIGGPLAHETDAVLARIAKGGLFRKLVDYVIEHAGEEYRIAPAKVAAAWLSKQAAPTLNGLKAAALHKEIALATKKEFAGLVDVQLETVGPHMLQLKAIYLKHAQATYKGGGSA